MTSGIPEAKAGPSGRVDVGFTARLQSIWPLSGRTRELAVIDGLLTAPDCRAVVLFGPAGVGKTRLAAELRSMAEGRGIPTHRVAGTTTASGIPFAAFAHLLPSTSAAATRELRVEGASTEAAILVGAIQHAIRGTGGERPILFVDDAHLLDSFSATVVSSVIGSGDVRVVATLRSGEPIHEALSALLRSGEAARIDIAELSDDEIDRLLHDVLGAPVEPAALSTLRKLALGNMLYLRELVISAVESGALGMSNGAWRMVSPFVLGARLSDLLIARISTVSVADQQVIAVLAISGRTEVGLLERLAPGADLMGLEDRAIIAVSSSDGAGHVTGTPQGIVVTLAHPLFGEAVHARFSKLRLRSIRSPSPMRLKRRSGRAEPITRTTCFGSRSFASMRVRPPTPRVSSAVPAWRGTSTTSRLPPVSPARHSRLPTPPIRHCFSEKPCTRPAASMNRWSCFAPGCR